MADRFTEVLKDGVEFRILIMTLLTSRPVGLTGKPSALVQGNSWVFESPERTSGCFPQEPCGPGGVVIDSDDPRVLVENGKLFPTSFVIVFEFSGVLKDGVESRPWR